MEKSAKDSEWKIIMDSPEITSLYKYRAFNTRSLSMLANNQVYFASPADFNDPFDCKIEPSFGYASVAELIERTAAMARKNGASEHEINHYTGILKLAPEKELADQIDKEMIPKLREALVSDFNRFGILSLSRIPNQILMWAHYAEGHKGFCIEFKRCEGNHLEHARKVDYQVDYPEAKYFAGDPKSLYDKIIFTKDKCWSYEEEWRVPLNDKAGFVAPYPDELITGIIFGLQMPKEHRETIRQLLVSKKHIHYSETKIRKGRFEIEIVPIA